MAPYELILRGKGWRESELALLTDPEKLLRQSDARILQQSDRNTVALLNWNGTSVVVKLFRRTRTKDRLEAMVLGSRAARVARNIERMREAGFAVPELVAVLEKRPVGTGNRSCVVMQAVSGVRLDELWGRLDRHGRLAFAREFGEYMRVLHERALYPQDTRAANFIVTGSGRRRRIVLVDLDRVRVHRPLSWTRRCKNLVQVHRSLGPRARNVEKLAFLNAYLGNADRTLRRARAADILAATRRKQGR